MMFPAAQKPIERQKLSAGHSVTGTQLLSLMRLAICNTLKIVTAWAVSGNLALALGAIVQMTPGISGTGVYKGVAP